MYIKNLNIGIIQVILINPEYTKFLYVWMFFVAKSLDIRYLYRQYQWKRQLQHREKEK